MYIPYTPTDMNRSFFGELGTHPSPSEGGRVSTQKPGLTGRGQVLSDPEKKAKYDRHGEAK